MPRELTVIFDNKRRVTRGRMGLRRGIETSRSSHALPTGTPLMVTNRRFTQPQRDSRDGQFTVLAVDLPYRLLLRF